MMKKNISLLFFLISMFMLSQDMSFDYILEKKVIVGEKHTSFQFYNSKTQQFLAVKQHNEKFIGSLYDAKKMLLHYFYIYENNGIYNAVYSDSYRYNSKIKSQNEGIVSTNNNSIQIEKIDNLNYNLIVFDENKTKKRSTIINVTLEQSDFDFFQIKSDLIEGSLISKVLQNEVNKNEVHYRILKYNIVYRKNIEMSVINIFKEVDLKIIIPDKLNMKYL